MCAPWQGSQALTGALTRCGASCGPGGGRLGRTAVCVHAAACRGEGETADTLGGTGRGEQRTANMPPMSVTPEVFQLKGWLKACALCQGLQAGAHTGAGERRGLGGGRAASDRGVCARNVQKGEVRPIQLGGHRARGAAHSKHVSHVSDARGVPAEGLVEGVRVLPRVASRGNGAGHQAAGMDTGGARQPTVSYTHSACRGRPRPCRCGGGGGGEPRTLNMPCMVRTPEVSQLRGWLKACAPCRGSQAGRPWCRAGGCVGRRRKEGGGLLRACTRAACRARSV